MASISREVGAFAGHKDSEMASAGSMAMPRPRYSQWSSDDVELITASRFAKDWEADFLQLGSGHLDYRVRALALPGLEVHWYSSAASLHVRDRYRGPGLYLAALLGANGTPRWACQDCGPGAALVYGAGDEHEYLLPPDARSLGLLLDPAVVERFDWQPLPRNCLLQFDRQQLERLSRRCRELTLSMSWGQDPGVAAERLLILVDELLGPWLLASTGRRHSPRPRHRLLRRAVSLMADWPAEQRLDVDELARRSCASPRSLYRTFREAFGVGPYEYHLLLKLRSFRQQLRRQPAGAGAITAAAVAAGFRHQGRFAELYRRHYGERPRDTLRRWSETS